jgi:hypothetical protein
VGEMERREEEKRRRRIGSLGRKPDSEEVVPEPELPELDAYKYSAAQIIDGAFTQPDE